MDQNSSETGILESPCEKPRFEAKKEWKLLKNVLTASFLFKNQDVHIISDLDQLVEEVKSSPTKIGYTRTSTITSEVINEHKATERLFFHIQRSSHEDLLEIDSLIENDPRKFTRSKNDPDAFINKPNINGIRPIYEASKNGYVETVRLLLDHGADPHLLSTLEKKEQESPLQVASRWNHLQVVRCLIMNSKWSQKEIKNAIKQTKNIEMINLLKGKVKPNGGFFCCKR